LFASTVRYGVLPRSNHISTKSFTCSFVATPDQRTPTVGTALARSKTPRVPVKLVLLRHRFVIIAVNPISPVRLRLMIALSTHYLPTPALSYFFRIVENPLTAFSEPSRNPGVCFFAYSPKP
jgi:hypothetical protein